MVPPLTQITVPRCPVQDKFGPKWFSIASVGRLVCFQLKPVDENDMDRFQTRFYNHIRAKIGAESIALKTIDCFYVRRSVT